MPEPKFISDFRTDELIDQAHNKVAGFDVFTPNQGTEDGILVSKVITFNHGLALEKYRSRNKSQREYLDNFVSSLIREFCTLLDSYTKEH